MLSGKSNRLVSGKKLLSVFAYLRTQEAALVQKVIKWTKECTGQSPPSPQDKIAWEKFFEELGEQHTTRRKHDPKKHKEHQPQPTEFLQAHRKHLVREFALLRETSLRHLKDIRGELPRLAEVYIKLDTEPVVIHFAGHGKAMREFDSEEEALEMVSVLDIVRQTSHGAGEKLKMPGSELGREWAAREPDRVPAIQRLIDLVSHRGDVDEEEAWCKNLVFTGGPGSGKSTFLRHVCLSLAQHGLKPRAGWLERLNSKLETDAPDVPVFAWPAAQAHLVPIFVELRKFADALAKSPPASDAADCERVWRYLGEELPKANVHDAIPSLKQAAADGEALLFFDGLDEVADDALKRFIVNTVAAFANSPSPVVVTCRTVSYGDPSWQLPGFESVALAPLDEPRQRLFIEHFYRELAARGHAIDQTLAASLIDAVKKRDELREMAGTPYLLSIMAQLRLRNTLPGQRAALFEAYVKELLIDLELTKRDGESGPAMPGLDDLLRTADGVSTERFRGVLHRLAFLAHRSGKGSPAATFIAEQELKDALAELPSAAKFPKHWREDWATKVIRLIEQRSGLLKGEGKHLFSIAFKLQEFMAASHFLMPTELRLTHGRDATFEQAVAALVEDDSGYWDEVVKLTAGIFAHVKEISSPAHALARVLCKPGSPAAVRRARLAADVLRDLGLGNVEALDPDCLSLVRERLGTLMKESTLPPRSRGEAGENLGRLGDPRSGVAPRTVGELAAMEFCYVPPGAFWRGDPGGEKLDRSLTEGYWIAKYPVTVAQYDLFVQAGGYMRQDWWSEAEKAGCWRESGECKGAYENEWRAGRLPAGERFDVENHPVVNVSWFEAHAFTRWLNECLPPPKGWRFALASEAQWEKAARGGEKILAKENEIILPLSQGLGAPQRLKLIANPRPKREFPWEGEFEADRANGSQTKIEATSAVGCFPGGTSVYGVEDLSGNVWEWCADWYDEKSKQSRVLRGGSWIGNDPRFFSVSCRLDFLPGRRFHYCGFRVVCVLGSAG